MKKKSTRALTVMLQPALYDEFEKRCEREHRSVSEIIRELMSRYVDGYTLSPPSVYASIQGGLIDPIQPLWGKQGEWLMYNQCPPNDGLEKKVREDVEKEYQAKLDEAYAFMEKERETDAQMAESGYKEAYEIIKDLRERMERREKELQKEIDDLKKGQTVASKDTL